MKNYLKTADDKLAYVKILTRRMNVDGIMTATEMSFIKGMLRDREITNEEYDEACEDFKRHGLGELSFSCTEAKVQAVLDAITLSASDFSFDKKEAEDSFAVAEEIGISSDEAVKKILGEYVMAYMEYKSKEEKLSSKFYGKKYMQLNEVLPETCDKKGFVRILMSMAVADDRLDGEEVRLLEMIVRAYPISNDQAWEAIKEFQANQKEIPHFSDAEWLAFSLKTALLMALADKSFGKAEKEHFKELCKKVGYEFDESILDELSENAGKLVKVEELEIEAFNALVEYNK